MTDWYPKVSAVIDNGFGGSRAGRKINGVVIHHVAGTNGLSYVANTNARNSHPTYHIANSGAVTGIVHPDRRPYSTAGEPDPNAVTFEIDNSSFGGDWPVSSAALDALIDVIVYHASQSPRAGQGFALNDKARVQSEFFIAWHSQYKATACPGSFLMLQLDYIVSECNKRASGKPSVPSVPSVSTSKPRLGKWLRRGSTGDNVRYLQAALGGLKVDGIFGALTEKAVKKFQKEQKIQIDGVVGSQTWSRLP
jgi:peptidoglycan hydrolase-like protein with peptidoglycan-binding domain